MNWNENVIAQFREGRPRVADMFDLENLLLLHTTGAKTGQERVNPLTFLMIDDTVVIVASKAGAPDNPDWYWNLVAAPEVTIERWEHGELGSFAMTAAVAVDDDRDALLARVIELAPGFADYQRKTERQIPVVRLLPR